MQEKHSTKKRVVVIGGGTGTYTVLTGLKKQADVWPTAIVSMADSGGSTGVLRTSLGVLPPGDIRRALIALSEAEAEETMLKLFNYRFPDGAVESHNFGNLFLAALEQIHGGFDKAVEEASRILRVRGSVIPVTLDSVHLHARYEDGLEVHGETNIDIPKHDARLRVEKVWLDPSGALNPKAKEALMAADLIVVGPGDLYTSISPNLLVKDMAEALKASSAPKIYVVNIMTKRGETHGFLVHHFIEVIERHLGSGVLTHVIYNVASPKREMLEPYEAEGAEFVVCDEALLPQDRHRYLAEDLLDEGHLLRHDADKLARVLLSILS